jgi:phosphatidylserine decarboxylase
MPFERVRKNFWTKLLKAFDLNNNGRICKVELETMLESLGSTLSEATIERFFSAVNSAEAGEIEIEEAVKFLEDLSVRTHSHPEEGGESIVLLRSCPFCLKKWKEKMDDLDVITHLGICSASESNSNSLSDSFVMGGFLTEEYASRKWFSRWLGFMSFGNYKIGRNNANIFVQDRRTGKLIEEKIPTYIRLGIRLLHQNVVTYRTTADFSYIRNILQSMSIQQGKKYDNPLSVSNIPGFIKYHKLPVHEIRDPITSFKSFNEFFYRRIKLAEYRPLSHPEDSQVTVSPADCRLNVFSSISEATNLWIKGVHFSATELLGGDQELGKYFDGGSLVIARLAPQDYHRFHSPVDGTVTANYHISGTYFTVNPMAVRQKVDVYTENARTVTIIESAQFGKVAFVSIGAMMVGSIVITTKVGATLGRMDEVGYFAFGGSTIVVLYAKSAGVQFDADLLENSQQQLETLIKVGDSMGRMSS